MVLQLRLLSRRGRLGNSRGNIFAMLFAAVALTGVLASVGMQTLTGPVTTITRVTQKNIADNNLLMNGKILVAAAVSGISGGDPDNDGVIEPAQYVAPGGGEEAPTGGGFLPNSLGLALTDPWGTRYGYCVWDHGSTNSSMRRITGDNTSAAATQPVIAIVTAGPDKIFQTSCPAYTGSTLNVAKQAGSDDIVFRYTYAEATASSNGLWTLSPTDQTKAELKDNAGVANVTIDRSTGIGRFYGIVADTIAAATSILTVDGGLKLDTQTNVTDCTSAEAGVVRYNAVSSKLEVCNGSAWKPAGSSEATYVTRTPSDDLATEQALSLLPSGIMKVTTGTGTVSSGAVDLSGAEASGTLAAGRFPALTGEVSTSEGSLATSVADDVLDFSEFKDALTLDAATDIAVTGTDALSITNTGTGNSLVINDEAGDTTPFIVANDGRVGIGTNNPAYTLQVSGNTMAENAYVDGFIRVNYGGLINAGGNTVIQTQGTGSTVLAAGTNQLFLTSSTGAIASALYLPTASIGVGVSSPVARLDVAGGIKFAGHTACSASGANNGTIRFESTLKKMQLCIDGLWSSVSNIEKLDDVGDVYLSETGNAEPNNNDILAWNAANDRWEARNADSVGSALTTPGGSDKQVQLNDGGVLAGAAQLFWDKANNRLGVGTSSPTQALDVTGRVSADTMQVTGGYPHGNIYGDSTTTYLHLSNAGGSYLYYGNSYVGTGGAVVFGTGGAERMRITGATVGIGTSTPQTSALLDLSSTTKGFLPPRMTTAQRDAIGTPATGLEIYNTTTNQLNYYNGTSWTVVGSDGGPPIAATYITQTPDSNLTNEQALSTLPSGIVKVTTATGVLSSVGSIDLGGTDASGTLAAGRFPALTGDVTTTAGSLATAIATGAVSYAKLQATSAASVLLGRGQGSGAGPVQELSLGAGLSLSGTTLSVSGVGAAAISADSLDFSELKDAMTLDASTDIATGASTLSITNDGIGTTLRINDNGSADTTPFVVDASGNVGIGTTAPAAELDVKGTLRLSGSTSGFVGLAPAATAGATVYTLPSADGTDGQFLQTNGSALLSWATASPGTASTTTSTLTWNATTAPPNTTLSLGNLRFAATNYGSGNYKKAFATLATGSSGKYYYEVQALTQAGLGNNISAGFDPTSNSPGEFASTSLALQAAYSISGGTIANTDTIMLAIDISAGKFWYGKNGTWASSGNPTSGVNPAATFTPGTSYFPSLITAISNTNANASAGLARFSASAWTYSAPSGFGMLGPVNGAALSALSAASATNTIDSTNFAQTWNWSTATTQNPLTLTANALTTGSLLSLTSSSASINSTNGLLYVANTGATTTGTVARIAANAAVGSGLTVLANGNVGIGTPTPSSKLDIAGGARVGTDAVCSASSPDKTGMLVFNSGTLFLCTTGGFVPIASASGLSGVSSSLSSIASATASNSILNNANLQTWTWALSGANDDAFTFGESAASTNGTGSQAILKAATLASSTAIPLLVTNLGSGLSFRVNDETGDSDTSPFVVDASGNVGVGVAAPTTKLDVSGPVKVAGVGTETCDAAAKGSMRYNSTGGYMEICQ